MSSRSASVIANDGANYHVPVSSALMMGKLKKQLDIRKHAFVQLKEGSGSAFGKALEWCEYCTSPRSGLEKKRNITGRDGFIVAQSDFGEDFFVDLELPALIELINVAEELGIPSLEYGGTLILHRLIESYTPMESLRKIVAAGDSTKEKLLEEVEQMAKENFGDGGHWSDEDRGCSGVGEKFTTFTKESFKSFDFSSSSFTKEEFEDFVKRKADEFGRW